jgi:endonuclease G
MPVIFVIHAECNTPFVLEHLLPPLPPLGFDRWLSSGLLPADSRMAPTIETAMRLSAAVLAVLSDEAAGDRGLQQELQIASRSGRPLIPVRHVSTWREKWGEALAVLPTADSRARTPVDAVDDAALRMNLAALLPPPLADQSGDTIVNWYCAAIPWTEEIFSWFLERAVERHDYNRGDALLSTLERHLRASGAPYATQFARRDLAKLRAYRQFSLMRRYAESVLGSGNSDFRVRRQYGQALIELGEYSDAEKVLEGIIAEAPPTDSEWAEAKGLIGRVHKQRYVNSPTAPGARAELERALEAYGAVFDQDATHIWHGINTVSLLRRAARDLQDKQAEGDAKNSAERILTTLDEREARHRRSRTVAADEPESIDPARLDVWDIATRMEGLLAVGDYNAASRALDEYLVHPDMHAFEVSSTYRQFDEVLQLGSDPRARDLMDRLWRAVERHRTGGAQPPVPESDKAAGASRPMLVRVANPEWQPSQVPDLEVKTRIGTIVSITGTEQSVRELLKDPLVVSIEESRPSDLKDCVRSVPFINVTDPFTALTGQSFSERGERALVAVIDDGIDVLHQAFLDDNGASRIVGIWDQSDSTGPPPPGFDFGTHYTRQQIADYVAASATIAPPVPLLGRLERRQDGHGTHVTSIAAGRRTSHFGGGAASKAQILFVISSGDESTGYSQAHLAALKFIDQTATDLGLPVVVNVSQGMNAGAHDGKSLVEVGFDAFSEGGRKPGRVIVKSAGNEGDRQGHAELKPPAGSLMTLRWTCDEGFWLRDRLELWWNSANQYRFSLAEPNGESTDWVDLANPEAKGSLIGVPYALQLVRRHVDNGDSRLSLELGSGFTEIPPGQWAVRVQSVKVTEPGAIHVWIERRDSSRSRFVTHADQEMTVTIPGTAHTVITVAAIGVPAPSDPMESGDFSSYGPTRDGRNKPDVCAPGVKIAAARGGTADGAVEMDGTSMAAPHVTGAIALVLSRAVAQQKEWPTASQITATLRQNTRNYNGVWTPSQGYGVVDVAALLNGI